MELLKNFNLKDLCHDLIIDGSESFYNKIKNEIESPIVVEYPYPIEVPSDNNITSILEEFSYYCKGNEKKKYIQREFNRLKDSIIDQDFKKHAILPEFLINSIQNKKEDVPDFGFNISYSYGVLEKFYNEGELCLIRPRTDNNLQICKPANPKEKIIIQWSSPDRIRSIKGMNDEYSNNFILRGQNNIYLIEIDQNFQVKINLKLKHNVGYLEEALNDHNKWELALMDSKLKLKLFDLKTNKEISTYKMKDLYFGSEPRILKMNYLTENMLMIMTDKRINVLDNRCKDAPQEIEVKLVDCDMLLDFTVNKGLKTMSNEVYFSSRHAFFVHDIRGACVNDYIHHNLRHPPCYINCFQDKQSKLVTLFGQTAGEAALFGTSSPYSLPYLLLTLEETLEQCRSRTNIPHVSNIERRLQYPITGVQLVPNNGDVTIYFCNIFGEIFRQDILVRSTRSQVPFVKMREWLLEVQEMNNPELHMVHLASARRAFNLDVEFNDVDIFNLFEKTRVHDFLADEEFNYENWDVETFDKIWNDVNDLDEMLKIKHSPSHKSKVEEWISSTNFSQN